MFFQGNKFQESQRRNLQESKELTKDEINKLITDNVDNNLLEKNPGYQAVLAEMLEGNKPEDLQNVVFVPEQPEIEEETYDDKWLLNSQIQKGLGFLNKKTTMMKSILQKNESENKSGFGWIYQDLKKQIKENVQLQNNQSINSLKRLLRLMRQYPSAIKHYHFKTLNQQNENEQNNNDDQYNADGLDLQQIDQYLAKRNYSYVIDETKEYEIILQNILKKLDKNLSNEEIKTISQEYLDNIKHYIEKSEEHLVNHEVPQLSKEIEVLKNFIKKNKNLKQEDIETILQKAQNQVDQELIKYTNTEQGKMEFAHTLNNSRQYIQNWQNKINKNINLRKPLKNDFNEFLDTIKQKITDSQQLSQLKKDQLKKFQEIMKEDFDQEFDNVEKEKVTSAYQSVIQNLDQIVNKYLKESLSQQQIDSTIEVLAKSAKQDLEKLKKSDSPSGFFINENNMKQYAKIVSEKFKALRNKQGRIRYWIPLKQTDNTIQELTRIIKNNYKPDNLNHDQDAQTLAQKIFDSKKFLSPLEDKIYDTITSSENQMALENYINKKLHDINENEFKYQDTLKNSDLYKELKTLLHENSQVNTVPKRLLNILDNSQVRNLKKLSFTDLKNIDLIRRLLFRVEHNKQVKMEQVFERKLKDLKKIVYERGLDITGQLPNMKLSFEQYKQRRMKKDINRELTMKIEHMKERILQQQVYLDNQIKQLQCNQLKRKNFDYQIHLKENKLSI